MTEQRRPPDRLAGRAMDAPVRSLAAHANARFTVPALKCPSMEPKWGGSARRSHFGLIFGGRRSSTVRSSSKVQLGRGCLYGGHARSETTAAITGKWYRCGAIRWQCLPSVAITWVTISLTGWKWARCAASAEDLSRQLVRRARRAGSSGRDSRDMRVLQWIVERFPGAHEGVET